MKNILIMLIVAFLAADSWAVLSRRVGHKTGGVIKRVGESGSSEVMERNAAEKKAREKSKSISCSKVVLPEGATCLGMPMNLSGRITSLCGFEIGAVAKLPQHPVLDKEGNIVMTGMLKKPFRKCTQYEVKYSSVNHALYSVRVFSPAQMKMDDEAAVLELESMTAAVKTRFDDKIALWAAPLGSRTMRTATMNGLTGQNLVAQSYMADIDRRKTLKGVGPEKGWAFSLELTDQVMHDYAPATPAQNEGGVPAGVDAL